MNHNPERLAAAYLTNMRPRARGRFESHLLACECCWQEVTLASRGRHLAETARGMAPARLRQDISAAVGAAATRPPTSRHLTRRTITAAAVAVVVTAGAAALLRPWTPIRPLEPGAPPAVIAAAVASYRAGRLPGTAIPAEPAPDLTLLHLRLAGAAAGRLHGRAVIMFAYRTPAGTRLIIIRSSQPFPEAARARELPGTQDAWTARSSGVTIICAQHTHAMLLISTSPALLHRAGALLNAI